MATKNTSIAVLFAVKEVGQKGRIATVKEIAKGEGVSYTANVGKKFERWLYRAKKAGLIDRSGKENGDYKYAVSKKGTGEMIRQCQEASAEIASILRILQ